MQHEKQQTPEPDPNSYIGSADKKFMKIIGFVVLGLALLVWADTATHGAPGEMAYANIFLQVGLLAAGIGGFLFWRRKR
jgi:LPXTG-motif cell wall-anchored protein